MTAVVRRPDRLCRVLDHGDPVALGDSEHAVEIACDVLEMDSDYRSRARGDAVLQQLRVEAEGVAPLREPGNGSGRNDRVDGGDERERRYDDLVAATHAEGSQRAAKCRGA